MFLLSLEWIILVEVVAMFSMIILGSAVAINGAMLFESSL